MEKHDRGLSGSITPEVPGKKDLNFRDLNHTQSLDIDSHIAAGESAAVGGSVSNQFAHKKLSK
jgi:hypothetical protein